MKEYFYEIRIIAQHIEGEIIEKNEYLITVINFRVTF